MSSFFNPVRLTLIFAGTALWLIVFVAPHHEPHFTAEAASAPTPPEPEQTIPTSRIPRIESEPAPAVHRADPSLPPSTVMELKPTIDEIVKDLEQIRVFGEELEKTAAKPLAPDYESIWIGATDIRTLAMRVNRILFVPDGDVALNGDPTEVISSIGMQDAILEFARGLKEFLKNPAIKPPGKVDARAFDQARLQLDQVIRQANRLIRNAGALSDNPLLKEGKSRSGALLPSRIKIARRLFFEVGIDCGSWTADKFTKSASVVKGRDSVSLDGVKVLVRHHKLLEEQVVPIDDCVDPIAHEDAVARHASFVALINAFNSYEVSGKVFAYQVTYQIAMTRGVDRTRFRNPVSFYYVDDSGRGEFELYRRPQPPQFLPEWIKALPKSQFGFK
jgi:hypothetical protein